MEQIICSNVLKSNSERSWVQALPFVDFAVISAVYDIASITSVYIYYGILQRVLFDRINGLFHEDAVQSFVHRVSGDIQSAKNCMTRA